MGKDSTEPKIILKKSPEFIKIKFHIVTQFA